jgi:ceramide glucosyltransferase
LRFWRTDPRLFWLWAAIAAVAGGYQIVAIIASLRMRRKAAVATGFAPGVSILKPVRAGHPEPAEAIQTNREQDYPGDFEVLCGSTSTEPAPNRKIGVLAELECRARYPVVVIADADISVPRDYLRRVVGPLSEPEVGLVTCAYRARAGSAAGRFEALGVSTDFAPSTFVAPFVGVDEFALGASICVRRADLERIGGIASVGEYLADDYQLGRRIHDLGLKCILSDVIVETDLGKPGWGDVWRHQVRWARTMRLSRGAYAGLPVTHAGTWALLAAVSGRWWVAGLLLALRLLMAVTAGWFVVRDREVLRLWWLVPARDWFASSVWAAGMFGNTVEWGGERLVLDGRGRIVGRGSPSGRS